MPLLAPHEHPGAGQHPAIKGLRQSNRQPVSTVTMTMMTAVITSTFLQIVFTKEISSNEEAGPAATGPNVGPIILPPGSFESDESADDDDEEDDAEDERTHYHLH